jgi:Concanavalin A-like lectin/glucanases superfamily
MFISSPRRAAFFVCAAFVAAVITAGPSLASVTTSGAGAPPAAAPAVSYQPVVVADAPLYYWRLNDALASTTAPQLGSAGTPTADAAYVGSGTLHAGQIMPHDPTNNSFSPSGTTSNNVRLSYPNGTWPTTATQCSWEVWIQPAAGDVSGTRQIFSNLSPQTTGGAAEFEFYLTGGKVEVDLAGLQLALGATTLVAGSNDHIVWTYDKTSGNSILYVNNVVDYTSSAHSGFNCFGATNPPLYIGTLGSNTTNNLDHALFTFVGKISEPAVYTTVLSPTRISAHYAAGT